MAPQNPLDPATNDPNYVEPGNNPQPQASQFQKILDVSLAPQATNINGQPADYSGAKKGPTGAGTVIAPEGSQAAGTPAPAPGSFGDKMVTSLGNYFDSLAKAQTARTALEIAQLQKQTEALEGPTRPTAPTVGQRVMGGAQALAGGLSDVSAAPGPGGPLAAMGRVLEHRSERERQVQLDRVNLAHANAQMAHEQTLVHKLGNEMVDTSVANGQKMVDALRSMPAGFKEVYTNKDSDELQKLMKQRGSDGKPLLDPTTMTAYATGVRPVGKDPVTGMDINRATYTVVQLPEKVTLDPAKNPRDAELAALIQRYTRADNGAEWFDHDKDGNVLPQTFTGAQLNTIYQRAVNVQAAETAIRLSNKKAGLDEQQIDDMIKYNELVQNGEFGKALVAAGGDPYGAYLVLEKTGQYPGLRQIFENGDKHFATEEKQYFDNMEKNVAETEKKRHDISMEKLKAQELGQAGPGLLSSGTVPMTDVLSAQMAQLRRINPSGAALLTPYNNDIKSALLSVAFGDGSVDIDRTFPTRVTKGAGLMPYQTALGIIRQLNPNFNPQQYKLQQTAYKEYVAGKNAQAIQQFNNFLQHSGQLVDTMAEVRGRSGAAVWNIALNKLQDAGYGEDARKIEAAVMGPRGEIALLLSGGYAPQSEEGKQLQIILSDNSTPGQISAALQKFSELGAVRLQQINENYKRIAGKNVPSIISPMTLEAAKKVNSQQAIDILSTLDSSGTFFGPQTMNAIEQQKNGPQQTTQPTGQPATQQVPPTARKFKNSADGKEYWWDMADQNNPKFLGAVVTQ